ncbi:MAG: EVE domain-containing protein [Betaproteobacteria bacterium]|nr:EVE domain-containing protein [Betaproteobacteria bacterium]MBI3937934.1 EVE domain-containing protein [Betaproteobacteria bacterium]
MRYWLMKSEPSVYSIDDLAKEKTAAWQGVRNYQARNLMRDGMRLGDRAFFYHSNCEEPGIVGIVEVRRLAYPDETQFNRNSEYFDPASTRRNPRWLNVDVGFMRKTRLVSLDELRRHKALAGMQVLKRGNRLSVTPVTAVEWQFVMKLLRRGTARPPGEDGPP